MLLSSSFPAVFYIWVQTQVKLSLISVQQLSVKHFWPKAAVLKEKKNASCTEKEEIIPSFHGLGNKQLKVL